MINLCTCWIRVSLMTSSFSHMQQRRWFIFVIIQESLCKSSLRSYVVTPEKKFCRWGLGRLTFLLLYSYTKVSFDCTFRMFETPLPPPECPRSPSDRPKRLTQTMSRQKRRARKKNIKNIWFPPGKLALPPVTLWKLTISRNLHHVCVGMMRRLETSGPPRT